MTDIIWLKPKRNNQTEAVDFGNDLYPQIKSILISRGFDSAEKLEVLKHPGTSQLHSPWLMKDMDKAVKRVVTALEQQQKILVYGDYDVDGTTAIALVYSFLKDRNADVQAQPRHPDRRRAEPFRPCADRPRQHAGKRILQMNDYKPTKLKES